MQLPENRSCARPLVQCFRILTAVELPDAGTLRISFDRRQICQGPGCNYRRIPGLQLHAVNVCTGLKKINFSVQTQRSDGAQAPP